MPSRKPSYMGAARMSPMLEAGARFESIAPTFRAMACHRDPVVTELRTASTASVGHVSLSSPGVAIPLATVPTIDDFYKQLTCATCILYFTIVGNVSGLNFSSAAIVCVVSRHEPP